MKQRLKELKSELILAANAAIKAGEAIMQVYVSDFDVEIKEDQSPLTLADQDANSVINSFLEPTRIPIISEENRTIDFDTRKQWQNVWIVDPLDGTKEFIKRNGEFTVNIARIHKGRPVLGVIFIPVSKVLYIAQTNSKTALKLVLDNFEPITHKTLEQAEELNPFGTEGKKVRVVGSRSHMNAETTNFVEELRKSGQSVEIVSKGSSLKFCLVAEGLADVYPRYAPTMEWDTAAGQAICEAVGLQVISKETQSPMIYNKENLINPYFIVSK